MKPKARSERIVDIIEEDGFASVSELSRIFHVSEMTIRRDLGKLAERKRVQRTFGGAVPVRPVQVSQIEDSELDAVARIRTLETCESDVLVVTSFNPKYGVLTLETGGERRLPVVAESLPNPNTETCVSVDNHAAAIDMGRWAGEYARQHWGGAVSVLDLTYHLSNTEARSAGFLAGLRDVIPTAPEVLSLNPQSHYDMAYQHTHDALAVNRHINVIFAINDTTAWGAINACTDMGMDPDSLMVIPFGLEGNTLKDALMAGGYCKAGLAMFPEIVGPTCVEAAIAAHNRMQLPEHLVTPYAVLTSESLPEYYFRDQDGWRLRWDAVRRNLTLSLDLDMGSPNTGVALPGCIGVILPFGEHEWYQALVSSMEQYAGGLDVGIEVVDAEQSLRDEVELRRREIARCASQEVETQDVIFIDGGPVSRYIAEFLTEKQDLTVITNSTQILRALENNAEITLISTGGVLRRNIQSLVGPTAEHSLHDLRVDKLFLEVSGVSFDFGLSHTNVSEVTIKQAMIRSAREVILLADYTAFGQESFIQVAPLTAVHKFITDDALVASGRLQLSQMGIQVIIANS